jgi:hypothetical protein
VIRTVSLWIVSILTAIGSFPVSAESRLDAVFLNCAKPVGTFDSWAQTFEDQGWRPLIGEAEKQAVIDLLVADFVRNDSVEMLAVGLPILLERGLERVYADGSPQRELERLGHPDIHGVILEIRRTVPEYTQSEAIFWCQLIGSGGSELEVRLEHLGKAGSSGHQHLQFGFRSSADLLYEPESSIRATVTGLETEHLRDVLGVKVKAKIGLQTQVYQQGEDS